MAGLEPVVVFWTGWGIHVMVLLSFTVQLTLLLLADIRRRKDWAWLKVVIWSAYMLADTAAIYALGHMSVVCRSPEHQLMALWAPLLLVHLGGQDNITAYAIEDNRLWLRHLQTFGVQVAAAGYVLYVSNILSHPSSKVSLAAMLMFVVGVLKYGERIWALKRAADSCASRVGYGEPRRLSDSSANRVVRMTLSSENAKAAERLILAYSMLDVPKQMFEVPTAYVQINNVDDHDEVGREEKAEDMLCVVGIQLSMMYDLLYAKAAVVHTWYGLCNRVLISQPFTIAALALLLSHLSSVSQHGDKDAAAAAGHKRSVDVVVTSVLLVGAVVLEIMSVLRAIFSKWTVLLLYGKEWVTIGNLVFSAIGVVTRAMERLGRSGSPWPGSMRQHSLFKIASHSDYSRRSKMAKMMGMQDWWDSSAYSWSTEVPPLLIGAVLRLLVDRTGEGIMESQDWNALQQRRRHYDDRKVMLMNEEWITQDWNALQQRRRHYDDREVMLMKEEWITVCWEMMKQLKLEETILVLHIATHVYIQWYVDHNDGDAQAAEVLANYMFFLVAARPNMLPYPVSRQTYVQLCSDAVTHLRHCTRRSLLKAILKQKNALWKGTPLQPDEDEGIVGRRQGNGGETGAAAQPLPRPHPSMNKTLDRGCQLAAKLIDYSERRGTDYTERRGQPSSDVIVLKMLLEKWVEMLCYTAYWCNENSHAKHLTDGGEIMNAITLHMLYTKNGLIIHRDTSTSGGTVAAAADTSSQGSGAGAN